MIRRRTAALLVVAALALAGAGLFVFGEFYRLSAIHQHPLWVYRGITLVRDAVVAVDSGEVVAPPGFGPEADPAGAALYQSQCAPCHGAPGVPPDSFALGMMPVPPNLADTARKRPPEEVYWIVRNGLKMTGMPAWDRRMSEDDMWRATAMVGALPRLTQGEYLALLEAAEPPEEPIEQDVEPREDDILAADPELGRRAMRLYACRSCHMIPGLVGRPNLRVGPPLDEVGARRYIAGVLPNTPENMVRWIMDPQEVDPLSMMPDLGVPEPIARDMAAYIYSLSAAETCTDDDVATCMGGAPSGAPRFLPQEPGGEAPEPERLHPSPVLAR